MFIPCPNTSGAWWPPSVIAKEMLLSVDWEKMLKFLRADFEQLPTVKLMVRFGPVLCSFLAQTLVHHDGRLVSLLRKCHYLLIEKKCLSAYERILSNHPLQYSCSIACCSWNPKPLKSDCSRSKWFLSGPVRQDGGLVWKDWYHSKKCVCVCVWGGGGGGGGGYVRTYAYTYRHTYTCIHIYMFVVNSDALWHKQAIFESKGDKLSSSDECRIWIWEVSDTSSPADWIPTHKPTELWRIKLKLEHNSLALAIYMFVVVNFDVLEQAIFETKTDNLSSSAECRIRSWEVSSTWWVVFQKSIQRWRINAIVAL